MPQVGREPGFEKCWAADISQVKRQGIPDEVSTVEEGSGEGAIGTNRALTTSGNYRAYNRQNCQDGSS